MLTRERELELIDQALELLLGSAGLLKWSYAPLEMDLFVELCATGKRLLDRRAELTATAEAAILTEGELIK